MITGKQIRAARALINISQKELSQICNISIPALIAIELEQVAPRSSNLVKIETALISQGIKFTDGQGVALSDDIFNFEVFEGENYLRAHTEDVIKTLKKEGGIAVHSHIDEWPHVRKNRSIFFEYYQDMEKFGLRERLLVCEGVTKIYGAKPMAEYRWLKKDYFHDVGYSVYGNKYAIIFPDNKNRTVVIENEGLAETFRRQFQQNWDNAIQPKFETPLYLKDKG